MAAAENRPDANALALDILHLAGNTLSVEFRFLNRALAGLQLQREDRLWFGTDGRKLYYEPWYVLGQYKASPAAVTRDYLHSLLHCVFRHGFVGRAVDRPRWDLACDIAVEHAITQLGSPALFAPREERQRAAGQALEQEVGQMTAEKLYRWLGEHHLSGDELAALRRDFLGDAHGIWYEAPEGFEGETVDVDLEVVWEEVSRRMQTELETMRRDRDGALVQNLRSLNRARHSYTDFLRRFGVWGETMRLSEEEFETGYYAYGLSLYGNLPLIEPLEYREERRIRDFVIAIDTSGSVRGEVVQSFIQHTHDILLEQESFFTRVNLHILQCDDQIREDAVITSREDFDRYLSAMTIQGLGRTDFRPVFAHVDRLLERKELTGLRGLLYFTDGRGTFPARKPPYETAFILHTDGYEPPELPAWAIRLELTEEEILNGRFGT